MGKSTVPLGMPEAMASLDRSCWSLGIKNNQVLRLGDFARAPLNCIHYHVRCLFNMIHETMFSNMNSEDHNIYIYIYPYHWSNAGVPQRIHVLRLKTKLNPVQAIFWGGIAVAI